MSNELDEVHSRFKEQVNEVADLASKLERFLFNPDSFQLITECGISDEELERSVAAMNRVVSEKGIVLVKSEHLASKKGTGEMYRLMASIAESAGASDLFVEALRKLGRPFWHVGFLAEMVIVYVVALQEAFVRDYLRAIFRAQPSLLRTGRKLGLTFEEACNFKSLDELREYLADSATEPVSHGNIDDVASYFEKRLNLRLQDFANWQKVREACYRRNLIVHNKGNVNETYREKTGYKGPAGYLGDTDMPYVADRAGSIVGLIDFVHEKVSNTILGGGVQI
jgi:hypothetical protein